MLFLEMLKEVCECCMEFWLVVDRYMICVFIVEVLDMFIWRYLLINLGELLLVFVIVMLIKVIVIFGGCLLLWVLIKIV